MTIGYYDICELTPEAGDPDRICRTLYFKWFYNIASKKCEQFIYGGKSFGHLLLYGNEINFYFYI